MCIQVTVHSPICRQDGDLDIALYGSFLPVPPLDAFDKPRLEDAKVSRDYIDTSINSTID